MFSIDAVEVIFLNFFQDELTTVARQRQKEIEIKLRENDGKKRKITQVQRNLIQQKNEIQLKISKLKESCVGLEFNGNVEETLENLKRQRFGRFF